MNDKKVVLIDAGHGFNEKTQRYERPLMRLKNDKVKVVDATLTEDDRDHMENFYREDHMTLLIAMEAVYYLKELGYEVHCTRSSKMDSIHHLSNTLSTSNSWKKDNWSEWQWIREAVEVYKADAFVSIHTNAGGGTGISCFYGDNDTGKDLAKKVSDKVAKAMELNVRRLDFHNYMILRNEAHALACLVECGFHDHPIDLAILLDSKKRALIGKAIAEGIDLQFQSQTV